MAQSLSIAGRNFTQDDTGVWKEITYNNGVPTETVINYNPSSNVLRPQPVNQSITQIDYGSTTSSGQTYSPSTANAPDPQYDTQLTQLLNNPDLTADQKQVLQTYYGAVATNDQAAAAKMIAAFNTGIAYSDPIFKAQVALVTDALKQGLSGISGDLAFREQQLTAQKAKLESDLAGSNEMLDFNSKQQLENLKTSLDQNIQTNADNMAATGKASSSVRLKSDELLNQNYSGLVESTNRTLAYNKTKMASDVAYDVNQANQQLQYYQDKATADRIALLRDTEQAIGSGSLSSLGYTGNEVLGNSGTPINSTIEANRLKDAFSFAGNFF